MFCFIEKNVHLEPVVLYTCTYVLWFIENKESKEKRNAA